MRRLFLISLILICAPSLLLGSETEPRTWGLGWAGGLTARYRVTTNWELNLAAGPQDSRYETTARVWDDDDPVEQQGYTSVPRDDKTESGWVLLSAGRLLLTDGPVTMTAVSGLKFRWSNEQDRNHNVYTPGENESTRDRRIDVDEWTLSLALRPSVALTERLWLETSFGLSYVWSERFERSESVRFREDGVEVELTESLTESGTFRDFGWAGTSSIAFMIWF